MTRLLRVSDFCRRFPQPLSSSEEEEESSENDDENDVGGDAVGDNDNDNDVGDDTTSGTGTDSNENNYNGIEQHSVVDNLTAVPSSVWMSMSMSYDRKKEEEKRKKDSSTRPWNNSPLSSSSCSCSSTIYVPPSICAQVGVQEGDLAWLSYKNNNSVPNKKGTSSMTTTTTTTTTTNSTRRRRRRKKSVPLKINNNNNNRVPVRIVVSTTTTTATTIEQYNYNNSKTSTTRKPTMMLVVPPIILTNLGVPPRLFIVDDDFDHQNSFPSIDGLRIERMVVIPCSSSIKNKDNNINNILNSNTSDDEDPTLLLPAAKKVVLQPLGRSPPSCSDLLLLNRTSDGRNDNNNNNNNNDNDDNSSSNNTNNQPNDGTKKENDDMDGNDGTAATAAPAEAWPLPSRNASELLQVTRLLSVTDNQNGTTFYYQILSIECGKENDVEEICHDDISNNTTVTVFRTSPQTVYEIDSSMIPRDAPVRRLPPLCSPDLQIPPHPNWKALAKLLIQSPPRIPSSSSSYVSNDDASSSSSFFGGGGSIATRIVHVVGTDVDNDLKKCIEIASNMVGLQCFTVRGLASFAFNQGHVVRTGSIADKLLGLESAFRYIRQRRMEPCVLHIQHLDSEFSSTDEQLRHDQEDRFWNKLVDELGQQYVQPYSRLNSTTASTKAGMEVEYCYSYSPPIIVVCSTGKPLAPGPFLNSLVLPSIELSFPDDDYIHYLWSQEEIKNDCEPFNNKRNLQSEDIKLLRGRPVHEIIQLRRRINSKFAKNDDMTHQIQTLCQELDSKRRAKSSDVSHVSKVHWEDVGGLAHVRTEIMDAIEIPLKYPHLFPNKSGGRTGILLYGPPGTGKTLVAKAVATECGLPFLSVKGPELLGSYVGESEANIRNIFESARRAASTNLPNAASILFFDELDSLAPKRGEMNHGGGVMDRVVATLLAELDGSTISGSDTNVDGNGSIGNVGRVFVLGATNRPDLLDPSLMRPGRLDRLVYLGIPTDDEERSKVLASQLGKMKVQGDVMELAREVVSLLPPRLSGADMSKLSSGAMLRAVQRLCNEAEEEFNRRHEVGCDNNMMASQATLNKRAAIDKILESWGPEKCTPTITIEDLQQASLDVSPSITIEELARYESIRENLK